MMDKNINLIEEHLKRQIKVDSVLSDPRNGWSTFRIGDTEYELSYLRELPNTWLDAAIYGYTTGAPYIVYGECEPFTMYCVVIDYNIHVFYEHIYEASYVIDKNFAEIIISDISRDIDGWAEWVCSCGRRRKEDIPKMKKQLQSKIDALRLIIEENRRMNRLPLQASDNEIYETENIDTEIIGDVPIMEIDDEEYN